MGPKVRLLLLTLFAILVAYSASATTYYIAANGSDSNNGTSKTTPWLHAPGMKGCASVCASASPGPGDQFIFRGGDTWHYSAGTPIGLPWTISKSGNSSGNIYYGVDSTWYSGTSWARPTLTMDNPLTTARPSTCAFDDSSNTMITIAANYVTLDNFDIQGKCWAGDPTGNAYVKSNGSHILVSNNYVHGWSAATTAADDNHWMFAGQGTGATYNEWAYNVIDGGDSSLGTICNDPSCVSSPNKGATGWAFGQECYNVHHNVVRHVSNGIQCQNPTLIHDNLFEYAFDTPIGGRHSNTFETGNGNQGLTVYIYNNLTRHTNISVGWWPMASTAYIFNNVFGESGAVYGNPSRDPNCLMLSPAGSSGSIPTAYTVFNNTFASTCSVQAYGGNGSTPSWAPGSTLGWANNHAIAFTSLSDLFNCGSGSSCAQTDSGGEIFMSSGTASAQGYTITDNYAPTSASGNTVGAGVDLNSRCNSLTDAAARAACLDGFDGITYDSVNHTAVPSSITSRPSSGSWDAGAYQFGSGSATVNAPSGLVATVH